MKTKLILSSGPTNISDSTLKKLQEHYTNQDLDNSFKEIYKKTISLYNKLIKNYKGETIFMTAEAMLALESACLNFIEKGDKVLIVANGIFGEGFEDLAKNVGADTKVLKFDWDKGFDTAEIIKELDKDNYKVVTMVHCETPTGITNDVKTVCQELRKRKILSIVDSVSAIAGEEINFDTDCIDVLLGGSQKCLSLPADLGFISLSREAIHYLHNRENVNSYYLNLLSYIKAQRENRFLYTQCIGTIMALKNKLENLQETDFVKVHREYAEMVRNRLKEKGFEIYGKDSLSNTVTAFYPPKNISADKLFNKLLEEHNIVVSGGLGILNGKILRIGHMGDNNRKEFFELLFSAIDQIMEEVR
ncbi:MAG: aminotransferase [Clostridiales bacterium]|nr:MAG: aminotransferase [Clostridiales bacterium]